MKKLLLILLLASCEPVRYVYVNPKDSTKLIEIRKRIVYDDYYINTRMPLIFNNGIYNVPFYNPIIIQRNRPAPRTQLKPFNGQRYNK